MNILVVIPYCTDNAAQAERLIDQIYHIEGRKQSTHHVLLAHHAKVHEEMRQRMKLSAEITFAAAHVMEIGALQNDRPFKFQEVFNTWMQVAQFVQTVFRSPYLYLEPDCAPLKPGWLDALAAAYENQPKQFLGLELKAMGTDKVTVTHHFTSRTAIYPADAITHFDDPIPTFNLPEHAYHQAIHPRSSFTKLIQQASILTQDDLKKLRDDAVLVHGDKNGLALAKTLKACHKPAKPEANGTREIKPKKGKQEKAKVNEPSQPVAPVSAEA